MGNANGGGSDNSVSYNVQMEVAVKEVEKGQRGDGGGGDVERPGVGDVLPHLPAPPASYYLPATTTSLTKLSDMRARQLVGIRMLSTAHAPANFTAHAAYTHRC